MAHKVQTLEVQEALQKFVDELGGDADEILRHINTQPAFLLALVDFARRNIGGHPFRMQVSRNFFGTGEFDHDQWLRENREREVRSASSDEEVVPDHLFLDDDRYFVD